MCLLELVELLVLELWYNYVPSGACGTLGTRIMVYIYVLSGACGTLGNRNMI